MNQLFYNLMLALGTVLIISSLTMVSISYLWQSVKPTVEKTELQYLKDSHESTTSTLERY